VAEVSPPANRFARNTTALMPVSRGGSSRMQWRVPNSALPTVRWWISTAAFPASTPVQRRFEGRPLDGGAPAGAHCARDWRLGFTPTRLVTKPPTRAPDRPRTDRRRLPPEAMVASNSPGRPTEIAIASRRIHGEEARGPLFRPSCSERCCAARWRGCQLTPSWSSRGFPFRFHEGCVRDDDLGESGFRSA